MWLQSAIAECHLAPVYARQWFRTYGRIAYLVGRNSSLQAAGLAWRSGASEGSDRSPAIISGEQNESRCRSH